MLTVSIISAIRVIIAVMMEAASTSETSVNFCQTARLNFSGDSPLQVKVCFHKIKLFDVQYANTNSSSDWQVPCCHGMARPQKMTCRN
jgi:hypothetical protein